MTLSRRLDALEQRAPAPRSARPVPEGPVAFARGLLAGALGPEDLDPTHSHHTGWLAQVCAFLTTLTPEHRTWEAEVGITSAQLDSDTEVLAALDAVMRRG